MNTENINKSSGQARFGELLLLVFGLILTPIIFIFAPKFIISSYRDGQKIWLSERENRALIEFETATGPDAIAPEKKVNELVSQLIENDDWLSLADQLIEWDRTRRKTPAGKAFYEIGLQGILMVLAKPKNLTDIAFEASTLSTLEGYLSKVLRQAKINPENHALAAIAAQICIECAWICRGGEWAEDVTEYQWQGMRAHLQMAKEILAPHDFDTLNSPLLACVHHGLAFGDDDGERLSRNTYLSWSTLDPTGMSPHSAHAVFLLPKWFGSYQLIEIEARKAASRTHHLTGAAAYAAFYLEAMDNEFEVYEYVDVDFFLDGVTNIIELSGDDQYVINYFASVLRSDVTNGTGFFWQKRFSKNAKEKGKIFVEFSDELIRERLKTIDRRAWGNSVAMALDSIAEICQKELQAGATLKLGASGLEISLPETG